MSEECFVTSEHDKAYIERVGENYLILKDVYTDEQIKIEVEKSTSDFFMNECSDGEVVYVFYDKKHKKLI